jgi:hypothetical protein
LGGGAGRRIAAGAKQLTDDRQGALGAEPAKSPLGPDPLTQLLAALAGELVGSQPGAAGRPVGHDGLGEQIAEGVVAALGNADGEFGRGWLVGLGGAAGAGAAAGRVGGGGLQYGLWHGVGNVVVVALFAVSWLLRRGQDGYVPTGVAFWLEVVAVLLALATAWAGGELVERLGVGVDEGANLDAPSSLSGPATTGRPPRTVEP